MLTKLGVDDPRWGEFVESHAEALPFHHPGWAALLAECYRFRPSVLAAADDDGQIVAGLPVLQVSAPPRGRRWASLPFTDYCPVLAESQRGIDVAGALVDALKIWRLERIELRTALPARDGIYNYKAAVRHTLRISEDPAQVYRRFSGMHQRNIRKSEREGVRVARMDPKSGMDDFYRLHLMTRRRLGVPVQPHHFFNSLADRLTRQSLGFVLTAFVDQIPVASAIFLTWKSVIVYKYGASDPRYWQYRPNNLLFWTAIRWACEHGYHLFDWGRTDFGDSGLRAFKLGWGAEEQDLVYSIVSDRPPRPSHSRMKPALSRIIQHSPPLVCQILGEVLYRYAA